MSDFPEGIAAPEGAQKLVDVCKEAWAVIQDESSDVNTNDEAVDRYGIAVDELNELGVHVNNEEDFPVFTSGVKDTAYDSSVLIIAGAPFLKLQKAVALSTLTTAVDLSSYHTFKRCNLLVLHQAKGASDETPSKLHEAVVPVKLLAHGWTSLSAFLWQRIFPRVRERIFFSSFFGGGGLYTARARAQPPPRSRTPLRPRARL
jgi:hypothetical protein